MSEIEHKTGKLKPTGKTVEQYMEGVAKPDYYDMPDDLFEWFDDAFYRQAIRIDGLVYEIEQTEVDPYGDIYKAEKNEDGTISFEVKFYNGGCSFNEAIEEAISKI